MEIYLVIEFILNIKSLNYCVTLLHRNRATGAARWESDNIRMSPPDKSIIVRFKPGFHDQNENVVTSRSLERES